MIMSLKPREIKFKPRIKLSDNISIKWFNDVVNGVDRYRCRVIDQYRGVTFRDIN